MRGLTANPSLRLVGHRPDSTPASAVVREPRPVVRLTATDPRWVLAVRTVEQMDGCLLAPPARQRLLDLGRVMGLSLFESNLVIAIVQDQARRGRSLEQAAATLAMVPVGRRRRPEWRTAAAVAAVTMALLAVEAAVFCWWW